MRRRAGDRVPAERAAEPAGLGRVHQLGAAGDRGQRQPAAERLAGHEQVGLDAVVLDRPDGPGAADAGLHLVVDVDGSVLAAELQQPRGEVLGQRDEPAFALHGLDDDARDLVPAEECRHVLERVVRGHAAVRIRAAGAVHLGRERPEALLVALLVGHRHRQQRSAVERVLEDDDAGLLVAARAILTAFSTASAPLFRSRLFWLSPEHGESSASRRQTSTYGS